MIEILVGLLLVLVLVAAGFIILPAWQLHQANRHAELLNWHLKRVTIQASVVVNAYRVVRNNGNYDERLALDRAVAELDKVAHSARELEPLQ